MRSACAIWSDPSAPRNFRQLKSCTMAKEPPFLHTTMPGRLAFEHDGFTLQAWNGGYGVIWSPDGLNQKTRPDFIVWRWRDGNSRNAMSERFMRPCHDENLNLRRVLTPSFCALIVAKQAAPNARGSTLIWLHLAAFRKNHLKLNANLYDLNIGIYAKLAQVALSGHGAHGNGRTMPHASGRSARTGPWTVCTVFGSEAVYWRQA